MSTKYYYLIFNMKKKLWFAMNKSKCNLISFHIDLFLK